jgi:predicted transcriptional regulator
MSKPATYKGKSYSSRSQCALAMIADGMTQKDVASYLGISDQAVSQTKQRLEKRMFDSLRRAKRQADEAMRRAKMLNDKADYLTQIYSKVISN